jgi:hypothetical protein
MIGTLHAPCRDCGSERLGITHYGEVVCPRCRPDITIALPVVIHSNCDGKLAIFDAKDVPPLPPVGDKAERLHQDKEALAYQLAHQDEVDQWWEEAVEPMSEAEKMLARAASLFGARPSKIDGGKESSTGGNRCASADSTRSTSGTAPGADEKSRSRGSTSPNGSARNARTSDPQQKLF